MIAPHATGKGMSRFCCAEWADSPALPPTEWGEPAPVPEVERRTRLDISVALARHTSIQDGMNGCNQYSPDDAADRARWYGAA